MIKNRFNIVLSAISLMLGSTSAFAVDGTSTSATNVTSSAYNQVYVGQGGSGGSGSGTQTVHYEDTGPGGIPAGTTSVGSPYIVNSNPCAIGNGGSGSGGPFGLAISLSHVDQNCSRRAYAGGFAGMAQGGMAIVIQCRDKQVARTFWYTYYLVCPGTKIRDDYVLPDGTKPKAYTYAVMNPVNGEILNIKQSPVLGTFIAQKEAAAQMAKAQMVQVQQQKPQVNQNMMRVAIRPH